MQHNKNGCARRPQASGAPVPIYLKKAYLFFSFDDAVDHFGLAYVAGVAGVIAAGRAAAGRAAGKVGGALHDIHIILHISVADGVIHHVYRHLCLKQMASYRLIGCVDGEAVGHCYAGADEVVIPVVGDGAESALFAAAVDQREGIDIERLTFHHIDFIVVKDATGDGGLHTHVGYVVVVAVACCGQKPPAAATSAGNKTIFFSYPLSI